MNSKKPFEQADFAKFAFAAVTILLLPALFTQTEKTIFDFSNLVQIGDTIGGITAPFIVIIPAKLTP